MADEIAKALERSKRTRKRVTTPDTMASTPAAPEEITVTPNAPDAPPENFVHPSDKINEAIFYYRQFKKEDPTLLDGQAVERALAHVRQEKGWELDQDEINGIWIYVSAEDISSVQNADRRQQQAGKEEFTGADPEASGKSERRQISEVEVAESKRILEAIEKKYNSHEQIAPGPRGRWWEDAENPGSAIVKRADNIVWRIRPGGRYNFGTGRQPLWKVRQSDAPGGWIDENDETMNAPPIAPEVVELPNEAPPEFSVDELRHKRDEKVELLDAVRDRLREENIAPDRDDPLWKAISDSRAAIRDAETSAAFLEIDQQRTLIDDRITARKEGIAARAGTNEDTDEGARDEAGENADAKKTMLRRSRKIGKKVVKKSVDASKESISGLKKNGDEYVLGGRDQSTERTPLNIEIIGTPNKTNIVERAGGSDMREVYEISYRVNGGDVQTRYIDAFAIDDFVKTTGGTREQFIEFAEQEARAHPAQRPAENESWAADEWALEVERLKELGMLDKEIANIGRLRHGLEEARVHLANEANDDQEDTARTVPERRRPSIRDDWRTFRDSFGRKEAPPVEPVSWVDKFFNFFRRAPKPASAPERNAQPKSLLGEWVEKSDAYPGTSERLRAAQRAVEHSVDKSYTEGQRLGIAHHLYEHAKQWKEKYPTSMRIAHALGWTAVGITLPAVAGAAVAGLGWATYTVGGRAAGATLAAWRVGRRFRKNALNENYSRGDANLRGFTAFAGTFGAVMIGGYYLSPYIEAGAGKVKELASPYIQSVVDSVWTGRPARVPETLVLPDPPRVIAPGDIASPQNPININPEGRRVIPILPPEAPVIPAATPVETTLPQRPRAGRVSVDTSNVFTPSWNRETFGSAAWWRAMDGIK